MSRLVGIQPLFSRRWVANRLPVRHGDDGWELSPGRLVTAPRPVMASHQGA
jgi:hypothetical protein